MGLRACTLWLRQLIFGGATIIAERMANEEEIGERERWQGGKVGPYVWAQAGVALLIA